MTPRQKRRFLSAMLIVIGTGLSVLLALMGLQQSITYFVMPSDIQQGHYDTQTHYRIGGTVKVGSISRLEDGLTIQFSVTDCVHDVDVVYTGLLPDLFREGQGIVAEGQLDDHGLFKAKQVLAKHDENYMPSELAEDMITQQMQQCQPEQQA